MPFLNPQAAAAPICGIGWRHAHYAQLLAELPPLGCIEVHSENFFADGGAALATLALARNHYSVNLHGVGLGLGSAAGIDEWHLQRLARLVQRINPVRVSDHACFARAPVDKTSSEQANIAPSQDKHSVHGLDLLPLPFTQEALDLLCANVHHVQARLQRPLLVENLSAYLAFEESDMPESAFLTQLTQRTGCQLLLDVNNLYVNALNAQVPEPVDYCLTWMQGIPRAAVGEIHLAGHCSLPDMVIDDHGSPVCEGVWSVYTHALQRFGSHIPSVVEWDTAIPSLETLLAEATRADAIAVKLRHSAVANP